MYDLSRFDAWDLAPTDRQGAWERFTDGLDWTIAPLGEGAGTGDRDAARIVAGVRRWRMPSGFEILHVDARGQTLQTGDRPRPNEFWLAVVVDGVVRVRRSGAADTATLDRGDMVFGPRAQRIAFEIPEAASFAIVHLPRIGRVPRVLAASALKPLQSLQARTGAGRLLGTLLDAIVRGLDEMGEAEARAIELAVAELFAAALAAQPGPRSVTTSAAALLGRAHEAIDRHLRDPGIAPEDIAHHLSLTPEHLKKVLDESGEPFNLYVRRRRLESAYAELMNPVFFRESIATICFRWGFNDSAYFSRVFKRHYGLSPSQHRDNGKRRDIASAGAHRPHSDEGVLSAPRAPSSRRFDKPADDRP